MKKTEFKKLQEDWYKKLEDSGFQDIETRYLTSWPNSSDFYSTLDPEEMQARAAYYDMATRLSNDFTWKSELEHTIWDYHTNGMSMRDIVRTLNKVINPGVSVKTVFLVIKKYKETMIQLYMPEYAERIK